MTLRRRMVFLVLVLAAVTVMSGCGRKKTTEPGVAVRPTPTPGPTSDFDPVTGPGGFGVTGRDLPLGERQPDMDRYFDPAADEGMGVDPSAAAGSGGGLSAADIARDAVSPTGDLARILRPVPFAFDSYAITAEGRTILGEIGGWLRANPTAALLVEGHCDERGSASYNMALGERRALGVREYLAGMGVAPGRLATVSYGEEMPLVTGRTEAAYAKNRRAQFKVRR